MNLIALARTVYGLYKALRELDLLGMFKFRWTLSRANILDVLLKALQCLVLQCKNPFMSSLARQATARFQSQKSAEQSKSVTMATMDEGPVVAQKMGNNNRLAALFKLIQAIQKLTSINIEDLCAIQTKVSEVNKQNQEDVKRFRALEKATPNSTGIDTQYDRIKLETQQRQEAAGTAQPFESFT